MENVLNQTASETEVVVVETAPPPPPPPTTTTATTTSSDQPLSAVKLTLEQEEELKLKQKYPNPNKPAGSAFLQKLLHKGVSYPKKLKENIIL